jgi:hypothetical protein
MGHAALLHPVRRALGRGALPAAALAGALALALGAGAAPVTYTAGGQLGLVGAGGDPIGLNFSTVRLTLEADTGDAPTTTSSGSGFLEARYRPESGTLTFSNRPNNAPDISIPYAPDLITRNEFAPSSAFDSFAIDMGNTDDVPGTNSFFVGGFRLTFINSTFFPGTGAGPLPDFDITSGSVVIFNVFYDQDHFGAYPLNAPFIESEVVPEPGSGLLVALGVAWIAVRSRRLHASA